MFFHGTSYCTYLHTGWHTEGPQLKRIMEIPCWNQVEYATITTYPYKESPFIMNGIIDPALAVQHRWTLDAWKVDPNFEELLNMTMPDRFWTPCCAQFLVHRKRILARPKAVYERIQKWLIETPTENYYSGRVMEYTWHVLFLDSPETKALDIEELRAKCPKEGNELNRVEEEKATETAEGGEGTAEGAAVEGEGEGSQPQAGERRQKRRRLEEVEDKVVIQVYHVVDEDPEAGG